MNDQNENAPWQPKKPAPPQGNPNAYPGNAQRPGYPNQQQGGQGYPQQQGYPPQQQAPYGQGYQQGPYPPRRPQKPFSTKAIVSMVLGGAGLVLFPIGVITGLVGFVLGIMAMKDTREPDGTHRGRGLAVGGMITSAIVWLLCAAFCGFMGFAISMAIEQEQTRKQRRQQQQQQESARTDMHLIHDRLETYYLDNGRSLGPGGPIVRNSGDGGLLPTDTPRVQSVLTMGDLVHDFELEESIGDYDLTIKGDNGVVVTCRKAGLKMTITSMDAGYPTFEDIPKTP